VAERELKAPALGPAGELQRTLGQSSGLIEQVPAAVAPDRGVLDPEAVAQAQRLREVARGDLHVVSASAQVGDHGPHHQHVRRVGEVDPDLQLASAASAATTSPACAEVSTGLIGSARLSRLSASVTGSGASVAYGDIAAWRCSGVR